MLLLGLSAKHGMHCQHRNMAASSTGKASNSDNANASSLNCNEEALPQSREMIKPTIVELTKEVRTNILCTVEGCGKILPNTPALNMHLVKSHRIKDGIVNPTVRKDMKGSQKLYCCPIEGCPRGPNRPFSQFSLVKQHFMKMHAEKKHKCSKCNNGYSTEWDLKRHIEDCGKTYHCTCGCPYASRAALLSHIYRTGHEIPTEHRIPPVKKRKMEKLLSGSEKVKINDSTFQIISAATEQTDTSLPSDTTVTIPDSRRSLQKLLLPKPKMALVSVPVMQVAHLPVLLPSTESGALRSVVLAVDSQGSVSALQLLPQATGAVVPQLDAKSLGFKDSMPTSRSSQGPISTGVQVNLDPVGPEDSTISMAAQRGRSTSTNIQTDKSYLSKMPTGVGVGEGLGLCSAGESSVSSCSQTDISVSAQVLLPVSVETQTFFSRAKSTSSIGAQTDSQCLSQIPCSSSSVAPYKTRQTQTYFAMPQSEEKAQNQAVMCSDLFGNDSLSVSTQTALDIDDTLCAAGSTIYEDSKSEGGMCFGVQTHELSANNMADNQTQTMTLLNDLENILSDSMSGHQVLTEASAGCGSSLNSVQEQHNGIDFDFEEFLNAVHIQTQTEESELGGLGGDTPMESLDIQTQTDFLLMDDLDQSEGPSRTQASDLELFDTQTQTDLNFLLNAGSHMPLSSILRHSSFSMSTESSDTETQTDLPSFATSLSAQTPVTQGENARLLNSTETQTVTSQAEGLGNLFLTSNETQTVMDDFLSADLAWNMESHFSSVETQTCEELCALFQHSEKPNS
ncbi:ATM interactor isoform X1 [Oreochromis niloticus]|uniref:ATM interactor n=2 Tax=Oreochromis niloticus TaxID=8128 RepID=A0A669D737_ORENI|nr:ATM interactor isoform X1 [Oreochromis niloticus]